MAEREPDVTALETEEEAKRRHYLGGGDAAAIAGMSPWRTKLQCYLSKRGELPHVEPSKAKKRLFLRGNRAEVVAIDMLAQDRGIQIVVRSTPENPNRYDDTEYPFIRAEIDFEFLVTQELADLYDLDPALIGTVQNGEVKSAHERVFQAKFGEEGTDELPMEYFLQALHGLAVTGREVTMFAVLSGWDNLVIYIVRRDEQHIAYLRKMEVDFWLNNVQAGVPPAPMNLPDVEKLFDRKTKTLIAADENSARLVDELRKQAAIKASAEQGIEEIKYELGVYMLGADKIALDEKGRMKPLKSGKESKAKVKLHGPGYHVLTWQGKDILTLTLQTATRIDGEKLRAEHPEIAAECEKVSESFVFRAKKDKA